MPVTKIGCGWSSGNQVFYDDASGLSAGAIFTIKSGTSGIDFTQPITFGTTGTPLSFTAGTPLFEMFTTSSSTSGSTSAQPFYVKNVMTGAAGVGGRSTFHMTTNVALGGWSNALKGLVEYGATGRTNGLGSAVLGELALSAGTSSGTYTALEAEIVLGSGALTGTETSFLYMAASGADVATYDTSGDLFKIDGLTLGSGKLFQENTAADATHALRIDIGGTKYYILLTSSGA